MGHSSTSTLCRWSRRAAARRPPRGADLLGRMLGAAGNGTAGVGLPLRLSMTAGFDTVTLDGQTLLGTNLRVSAGPEPTIGLHLASEGPDSARLSLDGGFEPGGRGGVPRPRRSIERRPSPDGHLSGAHGARSLGLAEGHDPGPQCGRSRRCRGVARRRHGAERDPPTRRLAGRRHPVLYGRRRDRTGPAVRRPRLGQSRPRRTARPIRRRDGVAGHRPVAGAFGHGREARGRQRRHARRRTAGVAFSRRAETIFTSTAWPSMSAEAPSRPRRTGPDRTPEPKPTSGPPKWPRWRKRFGDCFPCPPRRRCVTAPPACRPSTARSRPKPRPQPSTGLSPPGASRSTARPREPTWWRR